MNERDNIFNEYMNEFVKLDVIEKRNIILEDTKELLALVSKLAMDAGKNNDILLNKEILDLDKPPVSESDYLEAIYIYIQAVREKIGEYAEFIVDNFYK